MDYRSLGHSTFECRGSPLAGRAEASDSFTSGEPFIFVVRNPFSSRSIGCRRIPLDRDLSTQKADQNSPKSGSAQPSGSNSGGCSNQRVNGSTNTSSASSKGRHSISRIALTIGSWLTTKTFLPRRPYRAAVWLSKSRASIVNSTDRKRLHLNLNSISELNHSALANDRPARI